MTTTHSKLESGADPADGMAHGLARNIVIHVRSGRPVPATMIAAMTLARALEIEVRSVFVEDETLISIAALPCAREVSFGGGRSGLISVARLQSDMTRVSTALRRDLTRLAAEAGIPLQCDIVRDDPAVALHGACAEGAIVALTEPFDREQALALPGMFEDARVAGVLVSGPHVTVAAGPILVLVASITGLNAMMATAGQLQRPDGRTLAVMTLGYDGVERARLSAATRIATGYDRSVQIFNDATRQSPIMIADAANRIGAGIVIIRWADTPSIDLAGLVAALDCPLLLLG